MESYSVDEETMKCMLQNRGKEPVKFVNTFAELRTLPTLSRGATGYYELRQSNNEGITKDDKKK